MKFTGIFLMLGVFVGCQSKVAPPQHKEPDTALVVVPKKAALDSLPPNPVHFDFAYVKSRAIPISVTAVTSNVDTAGNPIEPAFVRKYLDKQKVSVGFPEVLDGSYPRFFWFKGYKSLPVFDVLTLVNTNEYCCQTLYAITLNKEPFSVIDIAVLAYTGGDGGWVGSKQGRWINDRELDLLEVSDYDDDLDETTNNSEIDSIWTRLRISESGKFSETVLKKVHYLGNEKIEK